MWSAMLTMNSGCKYSRKTVASTALHTRASAARSASRIASRCQGRRRGWGSRAEVFMVRCSLEVENQA